jgi:hypothetical protein
VLFPGVAQGVWLGTRSQRAGPALQRAGGRVLTPHLDLHPLAVTA